MPPASSRTSPSFASPARPLGGLVALVIALVVGCGSRPSPPLPAAATVAPHHPGGDHGQALGARPATVAPTKATNQPYQPPRYVELDGLTHRAVTVGTDPWRLPGTLTLPHGGQPCAGVVLVHGSGPVDQDGTLGPNKPLVDLALGLASRGIGVLRYAKRTHQHGPAVARQLGDQLTLEQETVADAVAATGLLRRSAGIDPGRVFVLGHSLGGTAIPRIARGAAAARGFIIMAGATLPLEDTLVRQLRHLSLLDGRLSDAERAIIAKLEAQAARVKALRPGAAVPPDDLPHGLPAAYWLDLARHPPAREIAAVDRPILVLHGDRDFQVTLDDFAGWQRALAGKTNGTLRRYPDLNHLFMPGTGPSTPTEYLVPGHVAPEVIDDVATWIRRN